MINKIKGGRSVDHRGQISYVNSFDMTEIKRFYIIKNANKNLIRGWRAHRIEKRWFYSLFGSWRIYFVKIDDWNLPSPKLEVEFHDLDEKDINVLHIPAGYGTAFQALDEKAELLVYADHSIEHSENDNYHWPIDYFEIKNQI